MSPPSLSFTGLGEHILLPSDNSDNGNQFESSDQQDYLAVNVYDTVTIENSIVNIFTPPNGYYDMPNYTKGRLAATAFRTRQNDNWSYKYYRYDERGRVKTMWVMLDGLDVKTVSHEYNFQDMVKSLNYNIGADFKRYRYRYDKAGRLQAVDTYEGPESSDDPLSINRLRIMNTIQTHLLLLIIFLAASQVHHSATTTAAE